MLTPKEIKMIADILADMSFEEIERAVKRVSELAEMENKISEAYQVNPMTFSSCEVLQ